MAMRIAIGLGHVVDHFRLTLEPNTNLIGGLSRSSLDIFPSLVGGSLCITHAIFPLSHLIVHLGLVAFTFRMLLSAEGRILQLGSDHHQTNGKPLAVFVHLLCNILFPYADRLHGLVHFVLRCTLCLWGAGASHETAGCGGHAQVFDDPVVHVRWVSHISSN